MTSVSIDIKTSDDALQTDGPDELARILRVLADDIEVCASIDDASGSILRDYNGVRVGRMLYT